MKFFTTKLICSIILAIIVAKASYAKSNFTDLNKNSFYKNNTIRQYFTLGGGYKSDYNSREYEVLAGYKYKSNKYIHEIDFLHELEEAHTTTKPTRVTEELYDFEASSRMMLGKSKNYANIYGRILYDEFDDYYYDVSSAVGLGRFFFEDNGLEASMNLGYNDVKKFNSEIIIIGVLRSKIDITDSIKLSTRGILTKKEETYDEGIKNVLSFKLKKGLFLEFIHKYEKDRYVKTYKTKPDIRVNRIKRESYVRIKYNF